MGFIKKHYEKVILGSVLSILLGAVVYMLIEIPSEKSALKETTSIRAAISSKPLPVLDTSRYTAAFGRAEKPAQMNLSGNHNLFNPVEWQKQVDGRLTKKPALGNVGPAAVTISKILNLYTIVNYESQGAQEGQYLVSIEREAEARLAQRRKQQKYLTLKVKSEFGTLQGVKIIKVDGTNDIPQLTMELADTGESVEFWAGHPYKRVDGYSTELSYEPERKRFGVRRVGDKVSFAGDEFTVAAINLVATNQYEVVLSAKSTGKKTAITYNAGL